MDAHIALIKASMNTAYSKGNPPTEGQAKAGNYLKGRLSLHGLPIAIECPPGSTRTGRDKGGKEWSCLQQFAYGHFERYIGADGDGVDVFIGPYPESERVWVVNQFIDGSFDEHKVMLGFQSQEEAKAGYLGAYSPGWTGLGSITPCSIEQLKWWLKNGDMSVPVTAKSLPFDGTQIMDSAIKWNESALPENMDMPSLLFQLRKEDAEGLMLDAVALSDITEDAEEVFTLDALVVPMAKLDRKMQQLQAVMAAAGGSVLPVAMQTTAPFKQRGTTNVAVLFELSDGQTVTIFLHNPDTTPNKLTPSDELISWKWMLNKKDITILVAPERGEDLNPREVARRIMKLAEKNSARFAQANQNRAARMESINGMKESIAAKEVELGQLQAEIADLTAKVEAKLAQPAPVAAAGSAPDLTYKQKDDMFTSFFPETPAGEDAWRKIAEQNEGTGNVLTAHLKSTLEQLRAAGYKVAKAKAGGDIDEDALAAELLGDELPAGWTESAPGKMATNPDQELGGIVDTNMATGKWFAVAHKEGIGTLEGFDTRSDAIAALAAAAQAPAEPPVVKWGKEIAQTFNEHGGEVAAKQMNTIIGDNKLTMGEAAALKSEFEKHVDPIKKASEFGRMYAKRKSMREAPAYFSEEQAAAFYEAYDAGMGLTASPAAAPDPEPAPSDQASARIAELAAELEKLGWKKEALQGSDVGLTKTFVGEQRDRAGNPMESEQEVTIRAGETTLSAGGVRFLGTNVDHDPSKSAKSQAEAIDHDGWVASAVHGLDTDDGVEYSTVVSDEDSRFHGKDLRFVRAVQQVEAAVAANGGEVNFGDYNGTLSAGALFDGILPEDYGVIAQIGKGGKIAGRVAVERDGTVTIYAGSAGDSILSGPVTGEPQIQGAVAAAFAAIPADEPAAPADAPAATPAIDAFDIGGKNAWELSTEEVRALSADEYKSVIDELADNNYHSEQLVVRAKRTGTDATAAEAEQLLKSFEAEGMTPEISKRQQLISDLLRGQPDYDGVADWAVKSISSDERTLISGGIFPSALMQSLEDRGYDDSRALAVAMMGAVSRLKSLAKSDPMAAAKEVVQGADFKRLMRDIASSMSVIKDIDEGGSKGYDRALFVSSIAGKIKTRAKNDPMLAGLALAAIFETQKSWPKPALTMRNAIWNATDWEQYRPLFNKDGDLSAPAGGAGKRVTKKEAREAFDLLSYRVSDLQGHTPMEFIRADVPARLEPSIASVRALVSRGWPEGETSPDSLLQKAQSLIDSWKQEREAGGPAEMGRGDANKYLRDGGLSDAQIEAVIAAPTSTSRSGDFEVPSYTREYLDAEIARAKAAPAVTNEEPDVSQPDQVAAQEGQTQGAEVPPATDPQRAEDDAFLASVMDGTADMLDEEFADRLEAIYARWESDPDMLEKVNAAISRYSEFATAD